MPVPQEELPGSLNPLFNQTVTPSTCQRVKRLIVGISLLPLRLLGTILNLPLTFLVAKVATLGLQKADHHPITGSPLAPWRLCVLQLFSVLSRFQLFLLGFVWIRVKGRCACKADAPILVANHCSGLVEGFYFWRYGKLAEASYLENPVLAPLMLATQGILVDRSDPDSRGTAKQALLRRALDDRFPQTMVFPEGTCTNGRALVQFKMGAFTPGVPVQPVVVRYPYRYHDPSFTHPLSGGSYILGLMLQFVNHMEVEYLPVYTPSPEEVKNPMLYAASVQQTMAAALGVPTTKHASEDVALCMQAQCLSLPAEVGAIQWQAVTEQLIGVSVKDAKEVLASFRSIDEEAGGIINAQAFSATMRRKGSTLSDKDLQHIFDLLDLDGDGFVDFAEYLCGVAVLNGRGLQEETASLKFVFDSLAQGQQDFTKAQLYELLLRAVPTLSRDQLEELFLEADRSKRGLVSRDEFIDFASKHTEDLHAIGMLGNLPIPSLAKKPKRPEA